MATLYENYQPAAADQYDSQSGTNKCQSFVAESTHDIDSIILKLKKSSGSIPHYLFSVALYAVDGSHLPTGSALATFGTFYQDTELTTSYVEYTFEDTSYGVTSGTEYTIVVSTPGEISTTAVHWFTDVGGSYATGYCGKHYYYSGWTIVSNDRWFKNYGPDPVPSKPINPTPAHEGSGVTLDGTGVTWEDGGGATSYNVLYGTLSGFLSTLESGVTDTSYTLRDTNWPAYDNLYYWRIDAVNEYGTTTGDEWYFTTLIFYPPTPSGVTWTDPGNDTGYTGTPTGVNNMITVRRLVAAADDAIFYESG